MLNQDKRSYHVRSTGQRYNKIWNLSPFVCGKTWICLKMTYWKSFTVFSTSWKQVVNGTCYQSHLSSQGACCILESYMGISASGREMVSVISCGEIVCDPTIFLGVLDELLYKQRCGIDFAEVSAQFYACSHLILFRYLRTSCSPYRLCRKIAVLWFSFILERGYKWFVKMVNIVYKTRFLAEPF